jgi:hypothetical protein
VPRGLIAGPIAAAALVWGQYELLPGGSLLSALVQSGLYVALLVLTVCSRRAKVLLIRTLQHYVLNPRRWTSNGNHGRGWRSNASRQPGVVAVTG